MFLDCAKPETVLTAYDFPKYVGKGNYRVMSEKIQPISFLTLQAPQTDEKSNNHLIPLQVIGINISFYG